MKIWIFGHASDTNYLTCVLCDKVTRGEITRHKQHLLGGFKNSTIYVKFP